MNAFQECSMTRKCGSKRRAIWVTLLAGCLLLGRTGTPQFDSARGDDKPAATGKQWAVLIGVEKYTKASPLSFTVNDVRQLADTLKARGGYQKENILEITDKGAEKTTQPFKESILEGLSLWLGKAGPNDTVLIYFTGHGFHD